MKTNTKKQTRPFTQVLALVAFIVMSFSVSAADVEHIPNSGFDDGIGDWNAQGAFQTHQIVDESGNNILSYVVATSTKAYDAELKSVTIPVDTASTYTFSYKARVNNNASAVVVLVQFYEYNEAGDQVNVNYGFGWKNNFGTSFGTFSKNYKPVHADTKTVRFVVQFGKVACDFDIDDISLFGPDAAAAPIEPGEGLLANSNFEDDLNGWTVNSDNNTHAIVGDAGSKYLATSVLVDQGVQWKAEVKAAPITVEANTVYELSYKIRVQNIATSGAQVRFSIIPQQSSQPYIEKYYDADPNFVTENIEFTTDATTTLTMKFQFGQIQADVDLDDIILVKKGTVTALKTAQTAALSLYPNPASDALTISGVEAGNTLVIYNASGVEVLSRVAESSSLVLSVSDLTSGIYFVKANGEFSKLIIK